MRATGEIIEAATAGITPVGDEPDDARSVRVTSYLPDKVYAESSWIGRFTPADAYTVAQRLADALGGEVTTVAHAIYVEHGQRPPILSMRQVAERAGLAESSIRTYRSRGVMPAPDVTIGATPGWLPATIDPWIAALPGRGARTDLVP